MCHLRCSLLAGDCLNFRHPERNVYFLNIALEEELLRLRLVFSKKPDLKDVVNHSLARLERSLPKQKLRIDMPTRCIAGFITLVSARDFFHSYSSSFVAENTLQEVHFNKYGKIFTALSAAFFGVMCVADAGQFGSVNKIVNKNLVPINKIVKMLYEAETSTFKTLSFYNELEGLEDLVESHAYSYQNKSQFKYIF